MFDNIAKGNFPKYNVYVQVMDPKDAETYRWNIFDMTKVWPHADYPLRQIGVLTLNENVRCPPARLFEYRILSQAKALQLFYRH